MSRKVPEKVFSRQLLAGWGWALYQPVAHYYPHRWIRPLCGGVMYTGIREPHTGDISPDDCTECARLLPDHLDQVVSGHPAPEWFVKLDQELKQARPVNGTTGLRRYVRRNGSIND